MKSRQAPKSRSSVKLEDRHIWLESAS
ncbi:hypothetical protein CVT25_005538 [Psilocybe cyanescens]|uniref:Uncharacterized protein n=1 Tax=Psilocybe cyanescens TaxID=93625 RepID=A0A409VQW2_PSICY|nr:hypothetical protein CVT25_005538 [Psilocybe cyanescens]